MNKGAAVQICKITKKNVDSKCLPDKHSYSNRELNCTLFVLCNSVVIVLTTVSSHHYSSSYFSKLRLISFCEYHYFKNININW